MAEKKSILVLASKADVRDGSNIAALMKKGVLIPYTPGALLAQAEKVECAVKAEPGKVAAELEKGRTLILVDLADADDAALDAALGPILEAVDRHTLIAVAGRQSLALSGQGVAKGTEITGNAHAADIIPTIAYVADVLLPPDTTEGRVLYAALKDPNARLKEIARLRDSVRAMQTAMERDNPTPWGKHDCA